MEQNIMYTRYLEQLIVKTLLPVYRKHCEQNSIDVYMSGIPQELLDKANNQQQLAALFKPKSGC